MSVIFSEHLPLLSTAPNGIQKLRGLILELAVRGKLVQQDVNDEPASVLLERITQERVRLDAARTRKTNSQNPFEHQLPLFELPESWVWVEFGEIALHNAGKTLDKGRNAGRPRDYITTSNLYWGRFELSGLKQMLIDDDELGRCTARKNDLLICEGGEAGRAAVWPYDREVCFQNHVHRARFLGGINPYFGYYFFEWLNASGEIAKYRKGVGISNMSGKALGSIPFTLPPIAEQRRIVAKVDELMVLCNRLEAEQGNSEAAQVKLVETLLDTLTQSTGAADLTANWQRIAEHFDSFFTTESSIDALKQTILQLAVMGKLVPQDPNDEPASELLERIMQKRMRLEAEGICKKSKSVPRVAADERPFDVPEGWEWERIGNYVLQTDYGLSEKTFLSEGGVPVLKMGDIQGGNVLLGGQKSVPVTTEGLPYLFLEPDDLLYNRTNSAELVGKTGIFSGPPQQFSFASYLIRIRCMKGMVSPAFLNLAMNAPMFRETEIVPHLKQQCGQANVNGTILRNMRIPVPPAAEQERIVAKVNELLALCDRVNAVLIESHCHQEVLASTLIESALKAA